MKAIFIINPISGTNRKKSIEKWIINTIDNSIDYSIIKTEYAGHGFKIASKFVNKIDVIIAIGGDGTVLEIGAALISSSTALGIIPLGSGNGLARHLNIPLDITKALHLIKTNYRTKTIDTGVINNNVFLSAVGLGFDAHIAKRFANSKKRGFFSYAKLIAKDFFSSYNQKYDVIIDSKKYSKKAWILCIANSSQYGNGAIISPESRIDDGILDICFIKKPNYLQLPFFIYRSFTGKLNKSNLITKILGKEIKIVNHYNLYHTDGDSVNSTQPLHIKINPLSLNVIVSQ